MSDSYRFNVTTPKPDADEAFNAGLDALNAGREIEALPTLRAVAAAHPGDARLWQVIGLLHRSLDELEEAVAAFARAASLAPAVPLIAHGYARATLEAGLPATHLFEGAHRLAPNDGTVLLGLAAAQVAEGRSAEAVERIAAQVRQHPGWLPGHSLLARLRWMFGDRTTFAQSYREALATAPRDISLWRELIVTLMHADRYDDALAAVADGRAAAGEQLVFAVNEAVSFAEKGEAERADRLFTALPPVDDPTVTVRKVRHLLRSGRPKEAAEVAEPLIGTPAATLVWPYLSAAWRLTGDPRWEWLEGDPRLVGVYDISAKLPPLGVLAERLRSVHFASHQPLEQSVRGGTQTDGPLFARIEPEIRALRQAIVEAVETHVAQLPPPDPKHPLLSAPRDRRVRFAGSWSVRLFASGHHANHIHPQGWFSSALYIVLPDEAERGPAPAGWLQLGTPQAELGIDLPPTRLIEPKPGTLALFPSTMWHGTVPFEGGERMTVAFDVAPPR